MEISTIGRSILFFGLFLMSETAVANNDVIAAKQNTNEETPSLDLLLYLGEFQDRDGSLLEPEKFDDSLKLIDENEVPENEDKQDNQDTTKISSIEKEDDNEKDQP